MKINNIKDLQNIKESLVDIINLRRVDTKDVKSSKRMQVLVCSATGCLSTKSNEILDNLNNLLEKNNINDVDVVLTGCFGFCGEGPIIKIMPDNIFYVRVKPEDCEEIFQSHILDGKIVGRLLYTNPVDKKEVHSYDDAPFNKKQYKIALKRCGIINPENIDEYIAYDGYKALSKCLFEMTQKEVIDEISKSGLRGRGGGGFFTGKKLEFAYNNKSDDKYIICNADEGDPGAFMDGYILSGDPHSVLESMAITGYAIGASQGIIYVRAEYPLAIKRLNIAIEQSRKKGLLGKNILGSNFSFDIRIKLGAGAFVCGEETALIASMEGGRGEPTRKPPFPAESGYLGKPTNVNNVETLANITEIILKGSKWFSSIGTKNSKGTKVFALAGKINNVGLVEVPMGTTLREIIFDIGGGIPNGKKFKAVQTGGPSGGVITSKNLDTPIDYESLQEIGSMMGSGGMIVMDEDNDMVEISKFYLEFTMEESCGKCTPCRVGTKRIYEMLEQLTNLEGDESTLDKLILLSNNIKDSALCGLGQTAPNPVLSTMTHFREEYEMYAKRQIKKTYSIIEEKCIGCTRCVNKCPISCIDGAPRQKHIINEELCIACGACYDACPTQAIVRP